ncbi:MAG TPA: TIGR03857 family LLM class F420-dependent oxidoreductase [Steroidobacteraceae bacterium]
MPRSRLDLGAYALPGRIADPRPGLQQAVTGEALGLGSIWVAERWEKKEIAATLGALSQRTQRIKLVAGMTHFGTRHPIVLAGMAATLQALSGNRFVLGFGRSVAFLWKNLGVPVPVNAAMADYAKILRSLWAGETVSYDGPAGRYPHMRMPELPDVPPPLLLAAIGPKTLALAGEHFDGVVLHPFLSAEGVQRSAAIVRAAAEAAGRDPASVKVYAEVVVAPDASEADILSAVSMRAVTYFTIRDLGGQLVAMNGWDAAPLERLLADSRYVNIEGQKGTHEELRAKMKEAVDLLPPQWLEEGAAAGTAQSVARRLLEYRSAGADEIVLHGTTTDRLGPLVSAYAEL